MYRHSILETYAHNSTLVGLCDKNIGRLALRVAQAKKAGTDVPGYSDRQFDRMIKETRPDCVIVCTKDSFHHKYIVRAMELGCNVISEKPMTTDEKKCQQIIDTQKKTGKKLTVTFNYRYAPPRTQVKELLMSGVIGNVQSVDFHWMLNVHHGADYYRRWHRNKRNSGGLMVHKATHHFDLVNWWLDSVPERVFASGHRSFYVPQTARELGLTRRAERCLDCRHIKKCPFSLDMKKHKDMKELYLDCEQYDGYYRDRCVFSPDIDIEDCMNVVVDYASGVKMSYSLNSFMPWEGYQICFNGTKGRLEHKCEETVYINADGSVPGALKKEGTWIRVFPHRKPAYSVDLWTGEGGHGGADPRMLDYIFDPKGQEKDKYKRAANHKAGTYSILTGIAANKSMKTGQPIKIKGLVTGV
jgi:predicted dehydrogenase